MKSLRDKVLDRLEERINRDYRGFEIYEEDGQIIGSDGRDTIAEETVTDVVSEIDQLLAIRKDVADSMKEEV